MKKMRIILESILFVLILVSCSKETAPEIKNTSESILVGAEYFNGWWKESPNKWEWDGVDWRPEYPDRIPLLGEYNSQETMDKEIKAAAEYGIDFFSILYYYGGNIGDVPSEKKALEYLNDGIEYFMNSPNSGMMKFMIELVNHPPYAVITDKDWDLCMDVFIEAMKHPSYLKIDGKAVLKIHGGDQFYLDLGQDVNRCSKVLRNLRERAQSEGVGELLITVGAYGNGSIKDSHPFVKIGEIDGIMQYMQVPDLLRQATDYPYEELTDEAQKVRNVRKFDNLNYVPYFPAGWNPRPWKGEQRATFEFPDKEQWKKGLEVLKEDLLRYPNLGFPKKDGTTQKAFTIYAWNEYGEGGFIAPTVGDQYMKLEVIKEVFGNN